MHAPQKARGAAIIQRMQTKVNKDENQQPTGGFHLTAFPDNKLSFLPDARAYDIALLLSGIFQAHNALDGRAASHNCCLVGLVAFLPTYLLSTRSVGATFVSFPQCESWRRSACTKDAASRTKTRTRNASTTPARLCSMRDKKVSINKPRNPFERTNKPCVLDQPAVQLLTEANQNNQAGNAVNLASSPLTSSSPSHPAPPARIQTWTTRPRPSPRPPRPTSPLTRPSRSARSRNLSPRLCPASPPRKLRRRGPRPRPSHPRSLKTMIRTWS